ncbi:23S rRNA (uracil(1939)-C(5))-methyltransferase RlmD [candidate division KSB1 bacterium]|nr:23S rRNA (uracil(1939)-C(5))-methyltransferase RlmD [candidate division KSB1 bacterium]
MKHSTPPNPLKKGTVHILSIDSLAMGGKGIARLNKFIVFVERSLPGQVVEAVIVKKKKNYAEARVLNILEQSPFSVSAPCPHFGVCGGCLNQNLKYEKQIEYKQHQIRETLEHLAGMNEINMQPILPSPDIYFYRNKMEFSFSNQRWLTDEEIASEAEISEKNFALGMHIPRRYDKVLDLRLCLLLSEFSNDVFTHIKNWVKSSQLPPYALHNHSGFWRFLILREGKNTGDFMVNIVTANRPNDYESLNEFAKSLVQAFPRITTIVHTINKTRAQVATGDEVRILHGTGFIIEKLGDLSYRISANSFFQTNTRQTQNLYDKIIEFGQFSGYENVYDLYCGAGSISVYIAPKVQHVTGIEIFSQAIEDARHNARLNEIENCTFIVGDIKDTISKPQNLIQKHGTPDVVIIDPPRAGMHQDIPHKIVELAPKKIIYVSCNPATQARDLKILCNTSYQLLKIQAIDMFPHTAHCEAIALLSRKDIQSDF